MKLFKYIFFLLLILVIAGAIYIVTLEGSFKVEKNRASPAPAEVVFKEVNNFKNWKKLPFWKEDDRDFKTTIQEDSVGKTNGFSWESDDYFNGDLTNQKIIPNKKIEQKLLFETAVGEAEGKVVWNFITTENGSKLKLTISGELGFWAKAYQKTQDKKFEQRLSEFFDKILKNIDQRVTDKISQYDLHVDGNLKMEGFHYLYSTSASRNTPADLKKNRVRLLKEVQNFMKKNKLQITGPPLMVYNQVDQENNSVIISAGYPTMKNSRGRPDVNILKAYMKPVAAIKTSLKGNYSNLKKGWGSTENFIEKSNFEIDQSRNRFEIFTHTKDDSPNPADWVTELYYPVKQKNQKE